jgi:hypothetical protein
MITNRIWCAAPGSVDAVGKSLQGCRRLRPHHEDHQLGVRVPTTEHTARVGPPSPLLLRSPQPMPLAGLFPQTVLITPSFTDLISFLSTPSAVSICSARSSTFCRVFCLPRLSYFLPQTKQEKIFFWEDLEEAPTRRSLVWEHANRGSNFTNLAYYSWGRPIRSLCAAALSLEMRSDRAEDRPLKNRTARSMFP